MHHARQPARQRQSQSRSAELARHRSVDLPKLLEHQPVRVAPECRCPCRRSLYVTRSPAISSDARTWPSRVNLNALSNSTVNTFATVRRSRPHHRARSPAERPRATLARGGPGHRRSRRAAASRGSNSATDAATAPRLSAVSSQQIADQRQELLAGLLHLLERFLLFGGDRAGQALPASAKCSRSPR